MNKLFYPLIVVSICINLTTLYGQKTLQELNALEDKKFDKMIVHDRVGYGYLKTFLKQKQLTEDQLPQFNKVGLLSFLLFDNAIQSRADSYDREKAPVYKAITEAGGQSLVKEFYSPSLEGIKKAMESKNKELLTPNDYLNSEEEKSTYMNAEIKPTSLIGGISKALGQQNDREANAVPESYALHYATFAAGDVKLSRSVGKLATDLDVEAFLSTQVSVEVIKNKLCLVNIKMALHAPNPAPYDENRKYPGVGATKGYWEGLCFSSMTFTPSKPIELASIKKTSLTEENYKGFDKLLEKLTLNLFNNVDENMSELQK